MKRRCVCGYLEVAHGGPDPYGPSYHSASEGPCSAFNLAIPRSEVLGLLYDWLDFAEKSPLVPADEWLKGRGL